MQEARNETSRRSRRKRRVFLTLLVIAASPALADPPQADAIRMLPPLPLQEVSETSSVRINEFCQNEPEADTPPVKLVSGDQNRDAVRLKPVGKAIGLRAIDGKQARVLGRPALTIEPVETSGIQFNPLVPGTPANETLALPEAIAQEASADEADDQAVHFSLSDEPSAASQPAEPSREPVQEERAMSDLARSTEERAAMSSTHSDSTPSESTLDREANAAVDSQIEETAEPSMDLAKPGLLTPAVKLMPVPVQKIEVPSIGIQAVERPQLNQPETPAATTSSRVSRAAPAIASVPVEPLRWGKDAKSSSSKSASSSAARSESSEGGSSGQQAFAAPLTAEAEPREGAPESDSQRHSETQMETPPARASQRKPAAIQLEVVAPFELSQQAAAEPIASVQARPTVEMAPPQQVEPEERAAPGSEIGRQDSSVLASPMPSSSPRSAPKYRPPVAVTQLPLAGTRGPAQETGNGSSSVQRVQALELGQSAPFENAAGSALTPLQLAKAEVRSLTVGGTIVDVQVADPTVCQVFRTSRNQLKLMGVESGVTRMLVKAQAEEAETTQSRVFEVQVTGTGVSPEEEILQHASLLNQSIEVAFPRCHVTVRPQVDHLLVTGTCDSDETARRIMRMVRKTCLIPVRDQLKVH